MSITSIDLHNVVTLKIDDPVEFQLHHPYPKTTTRCMQNIRIVCDDGSLLNINLFSINPLNFRSVSADANIKQR